MSPKAKTEVLFIPGLFAALLFALPLSGCGLKGDLYIPAPPAETEPDASGAQTDEIDQTKKDPSGITD